MELNDSNFVVYAAKHYDNPYMIDESEFHNDLNVIKYLKKLFTSYRKNGVLKERLILNHLILFYNVFESEQATLMLIFRMNQEQYSILKTFLIFLNKIGDHQLSEIEMDGFVLRRLNELDRKFHREI